MEKPFSQACENNKMPILEQLKVEFSDNSQVLEIGSGTGQHAVHFAAALKHLTWQTSDMPSNHPGIKQWIRECPCENLLSPIEFTIGKDKWPELTVDAVFTANTTHIMQPSEAQQMLEVVAKKLPTNGVFCQYGPFNVEGRYTSASNEAFDHSLKQRGFGGIRDIEELRQWAGGELQLRNTVSMPANNKLLVWFKP